MNESFEERWTRLWHALGQPEPAGLLQALLAAWREPQRHYHTLQHLAECFAHLDALRAAAGNADEIELALWFHDAVYDVRAHDNEARSADWARRALAGAGLAAPLCERVAELVMVTSHAAVPASPDARLLTDIDLAILGAPPARFAEYERQIRAEYAHVPAPQFARKRREVLQGFLGRPRIYERVKKIAMAALHLLAVRSYCLRRRALPCQFFHTLYGMPQFARLEAQARANLAHALGN